jgi:hypothetical protein
MGIRRHRSMDSVITGTGKRRMIGTENRMRGMYFIAHTLHAISFEAVYDRPAKWLRS